MELSDIIARDSIIANGRASSKKQVLQDVSELASRRIDRPARDVFDLLQQRERLGSTGIGNGVAIPHAKLPGIPRIEGIFARLTRPVPFDAMDDEPVDLVFAILAPEGSGADHLKALSRVARIMRDGPLLTTIRATDEPDAIYQLLKQPERSFAA